MPKAFEQCRKNGGRIRTISGPNKQWNLKQGEFVHVCFDGKGAHRGHTKKRKKLDEAVEKGTKG